MARTERGDKRTQILDAALEVFSRKGVFATRIADIASEAGIAYGLVYHYFKNKEDVLSTIFEERWSLVTELLERAEKEGTDTAERLKRAADVFIRGYRREPRVVELLVLEFSRMSKFLEPPQIARVTGALAVITRIIARGQAEGEVRDDLDPALLTLSYFGGIQLIVQSQILGAFEAPPGFEIDGPPSLVDAFLNGVKAT